MGEEEQFVAAIVILSAIVVGWWLWYRTKRTIMPPKRSRGMSLPRGVPMRGRGRTFIANTRSLGRTYRQNEAKAPILTWLGIPLLIIILLVAALSVPGLTGPRGPRGADGTGGGGGGGQGEDGFTALVVSLAEGAGANCPNAGVRINSGLDDGGGGGTPRDGILQSGEIDYVSYACNGGPGATGTNSLVSTEAEGAGANCANAGRKVNSGLDNGDGGGTANNGILEAGEIDAFTYVCNGLNGAAGSNGYNSLIDVVAEPPGVNCADGGKKVYSGIDNGDGGGTAGNNLLEAGERDQTNYVCDGADGTNGYNALVTSSAESPGVNCANGGIKVQAGTDNGDGGGTANDGTLQAGEIDTTGYACNGAPGADGGLKYTYNTGTSGDPGSGKFGFDTTTLSSITTFRISETDGDSNALATLIATWDDSTTTTARSTITIRGDGAPSRLLVFTITSAITDNGAYDSFTVSYIASAGTWANNDVDRIQQSRTGDRGTDGLNAGLLYTYDTGTSGDPGSGHFGFDTTTLSAIATFRISETDGNSNGIAALIATWDDSSTTGARSTITIIGNGAPTRLLVFTITSAITDNGAYDSFSVAYVTSTGSWADEDVDRLSQARTGDKGADGSSGAGFTLVDSLSAAFTSTSTTGAEVTGLTNALTTTHTYVFVYYLICRTAATGTGIDFGVNYDSTQSIIIATMRYQDSGATTSNGIAEGSLNTDGGEGVIAGGATSTESTTAPNLNVITGVVTASEDFMVYIEGIVITTGDGNLELWVATDVASSQVDVRTGSSLTVIQTA